MVIPIVQVAQNWCWYVFSRRSSLNYRRVVTEHRMLIRSFTYPLNCSVFFSFPPKYKVTSVLLCVATEVNVCNDSASTRTFFCLSFIHSFLHVCFLIFFLIPFLFYSFSLLPSSCVTFIISFLICFWLAFLFHPPLLDYAKLQRTQVPMLPEAI